jgi:peroxiredoxin
MSGTTPASTPANSPLKNAVLLCVSLAALGFAAWYIYQQLQPEQYMFEIADVQRETNRDNITAEQLLDLHLVDEQGQPVSLRERQGQQHLVIVFTRGSLATVAAANKGPQLPQLPNVCPYCSSQASGIANYMPQFAEQQTAVVLVFPVTQLSENQDAATFQQALPKPDNRTPFPVLLDLQLKAVEKLDIRDHLARPAAFIIDKAGNLRFAYVAQQGSADRPSGSELLRHVKQINAEFPANPPTEEEPPKGVGTEPGATIEK